MELFQRFNLVLPEMSESLSQDKYTHLLTTLQSSILEMTPEQRKQRRLELNPSARKFFMVHIKNPLPLPFERDKIGPISHDHINLSSLKRSQRSLPPNDISCAHLPLCRKIISKIALKQSTIGGTLTSSSSASGSGSFELDEAKSQIGEKEEDLAPLIGKISSPMLEYTPPTPLPLGFTRTKNEKCENGDVRKDAFDLSHSITNPLYKNYNPAGFVKSEDVETREFILSLVIEFNTWLHTLQGNPIQLDPQLLIKIVREDLEVPDPKDLKTLHSLMDFRMSQII